MRQKLLLLLLISCLSVTISAQEVDPKLANALQNTLDSMRTVLNVKGLSAALVLPNDAVWEGVSGISAETSGGEMTTDMVLAIGSATKTLTAACILQLQDENILSIDDSLHHWLQPIEHVSPNITIRQLLQHRSGLFDIFANPVFQPTLLNAPQQIWSAEEVLETYLQEPNAAPGTTWAYCNSNYLLLGMIIEEAIGTTYYDEIRDRFLDPLEMTSFNCYPHEEFQNPVAHLWLDLDGDMTLDDAHNFITNWRSLWSASMAAGAYFGTAGDLARWQKELNGGDILQPETLAAAHTTIPSGQSGGSRYGLGIVERIFLGIEGYGHGGDISYSTNAFYFPEKNIAIATLCNDASKNSWTSSPALRELLRTYIDCEEELTATPQIAARESLRVFPVPFESELHLAVNIPQQERVTLTIWDQSGRSLRIMEQDIFPGEVITIPDLENTPAGFYTISVEMSGGKVYREIVIKME